MKTPAPEAIRAALAAAVESPCEKSKRGAAVWDPKDPDGFVARGFNGRPGGLCNRACQPDPRDRERDVSRCSMLAVHAEARAIREAIAMVGVADLSGFELVHVKAELVDPDDDDNRTYRIAISGPPSCWSCSKEIVEVGLDAVWLFNAEGWRRYPVDEFQALTLEKTIPPDLLHGGG